MEIYQRVLKNHVFGIRFSKSIFEILSEIMNFENMQPYLLIFLTSETIHFREKVLPCVTKKQNIITLLQVGSARPK